MEPNETNSTPEFDFPELDFGDPEPQPAPASAPAATPEPAPAAPQPAPPAPSPTPAPAQAVFGPATARVQQELEAVKARYAALVQQRKALEESGLSVPLEVQEELNRLLVRQEALSIALNDAKRTDAMARIPALVQQGLATLPPNWAKAVRPYYEQVLQNAVAANPDVVNDQVTLGYLLNLAIGAAQRDALAKRAVQAQPAQGAYSTPPTPKPESVAMPDEVRRYGVSEETWKRVATQKPDQSGYYDLDW
jgi:hypothetical protein